VFDHDAIKPHLVPAFVEMESRSGVAINEAWRDKIQDLANWTYLHLTLQLEGKTEAEIELDKQNMLRKIVDNETYAILEGFPSYRTSCGRCSAWFVPEWCVNGPKYDPHFYTILMNAADATKSLQYGMMKNGGEDICSDCIALFPSKTQDITPVESV
tara:strand:+ start:773 stop:1243 length:471 start_codon:yes stop_codon:yes gene_type:complete